MATRPDLRFGLTCISIFSAIVLSMAGCSPSHPTQSVHPTATVPSAQATPTDVWQTLQERTPFPYTLPLPSPANTAVDGIYVKQEPLVAEHVPCKRCPDWLYEGGLWKIRFDRGVYRVFHADVGWRSIGSYTVAEDRLILFNDPYCPQDVGVYAWKLEKGTLTFQVIDDPCAIQLRGKNLAHLPWLSCQPPNVEAAVTNHWEKPQGCE